EDADLDGRDLRLHPIEQSHHLFFLARIDAERVRLAARLTDRARQRLQLVGVTARDHRRIALTGEPLGYRPAQRVARADDDDRLVGHLVSLPTKGPLEITL